MRKGLLAVLGGVPSDKWKSLLIAPGNTNYFSVVIDPGLLDVRRGDELRVEVDSWSSCHAHWRVREAAYVATV